MVVHGVKCTKPARKDMRSYSVDGLRAAGLYRYDAWGNCTLSVASPVVLSSLREAQISMSANVTKRGQRDN